METVKQGMNVSLSTSRKRPDPTVTLTKVSDYKPVPSNSGDELAHETIKQGNHLLREHESTSIKDIASSIEEAFERGLTMRDASIIPDEVPSK